MLKIRFILLFGVVLGGALSFAAIKGRPRAETSAVKKVSAEITESRHPSQE